MSKVETEYAGLTLRGEIVVGDTEGDASVPGGVRTLPPYVSELEVITPTGVDMYEYLTDAAIVSLSKILIEHSGEC